MKNNTPTEKIVWESPEKNKDGRSYLTVKNNNGYLYSERLGMDSVAFVLFDRNKQKSFGIISERKPPMDVREECEFMLCTAFGGSNDSDMSLEEIVQAECREEAGYTVDIDRVIPLTSTMVSTQSNQVCHLYVVDVTDIEEGEKEPENDMEAKAETVWFDFSGIIDNSDWKSITIVATILNLNKEE